MSKSTGQRKQLEQEGWTRRTVTDEPRLSELVELYEEIGFEVMVLPVSPEDLDGCSVCLDPAGDRYRTIFTKPGGRQEGGTQRKRGES